MNRRFFLKLIPAIFSAATYVKVGLNSGIERIRDVVAPVSPADFADRAQEFFNPNLMEALSCKLQLSKYADTKGYAVVGIGDELSTIRFFRSRKNQLLPNSHRG